jgi:hypothetical protein
VSTAGQPEPTALRLATAPAGEQEPTELRAKAASPVPAEPTGGVSPLVAEPLDAMVRPLTYSRQQLAEALGIWKPSRKREPLSSKILV